jgi:hypothetical protein
MTGVVLVLETFTGFFLSITYEDHQVRSKFYFVLVKYPCVATGYKKIGHIG